MGKQTIKVDDAKLTEAIEKSIANYGDKFQGWGVDVFVEMDGNIYVSNENSGNQSYPHLKSVAWCRVENSFYDEETDDKSELVSRSEEFFKQRLEQSAEEEGYEIEWC